MRTLAGAAFVIGSARMAFATVILPFGWLLVATSVALALVPWRFGQRFAAWSVPKAMQYLPIIAFASLAGGIGLIVAVVRPRTAG